VLTLPTLNTYSPLSSMHNSGVDTSEILSLDEVLKRASDTLDHPIISPAAAAVIPPASFPLAVAAPAGQPPPSLPIISPATTAITPPVSFPLPVAAPTAHPPPSLPVITSSSSPSRPLTRHASQLLNNITIPSDDAVLASFNEDTSAPSLSRKQKGKEVAAPALAKASPSKKASTSKAEDANVAARFSSISSRVEGLHHELAGDIDILRAQITSLAQEVIEISTPDPRLNRVIASNNELVGGMADLHRQVRSLSNAMDASRQDVAPVSDALLQLTEEVRSLRRANFVSQPDLVPATSRARTSHEISSTLIPTAPQPLSHSLHNASFPLPPAHATTSTLGPAPSAAGASRLPLPPPPVNASGHPSHNANRGHGSRPSASYTPYAQVLFGPMHWDRDITGQFRAILPLVPNGSLINPRNIVMARRAPQQGYLIVDFSLHADAVSFVNNFTTSPPPGYSNVTASLVMGN
jgi:hypothetical protein